MTVSISVLACVLHISPQIHITPSTVSPLGHKHGTTYNGQAAWAYGPAETVLRNKRLIIIIYIIVGQVVIVVWHAEVIVGVR